MGLNPTPLPIVELEEIRKGDSKATGDSLENILVHLERIREVLFDSTTEDSLAAQIQALRVRPKDIYTFPISAPVVSGGEGGKPYAAIPLDAAFDGLVSEVYAKIQKDTGVTTFRVEINGVTYSNLSIGGGTMVAHHKGYDPETDKDFREFPNESKILTRQTIKVVITSAPEDPTDTDLVVQVMVR